MANIFDYLAWRGDLDFKTSPFNPVDNIILSQLAYLTLDDIVPGPGDREGISMELAIRIYNEKLHSPEGIKQTSFFKDDPKLINAIALSRRFGDCHLYGYINHVDTDREIQFAALTVYINDGTCFVSFRGTDISIVGWKENFNMSFKEEIPSQLEAVKYLEQMASLSTGHLRVGGHSKGGNLAMFAASQCDKHVQKRIITVYSNDAPGFHEKIIESDGFNAVKNRILSFVPQSSVIGMFLKQGYDNIVIKSSQTGLMQHDLYSWEVTHNNLVHMDKATNSSRYVNKTLREWIDSFDAERREQFIEAIYYIISKAEITSIHELEASWFASACKIIKSFSHIDTQTKKILRNFIAELFRSAERNFDTLLINEK